MGHILYNRKIILVLFPHEYRVGEILRHWGYSKSTNSGLGQRTDGDSIRECCGDLGDAYLNNGLLLVCYLDAG